jgi:Ribbon-helix-helix protein, copG family.
MSEGKTRPVQIRVSEEEYKQMEEKAGKLGLTVSAYLRFVALYADVSVVMKID